jgi:CO/xanthine dehydrogenase FAD-binding subunit
MLSLDARVEVASCAGRRILSLADFITGYRRTALGPGEIVTAVIVPRPSPAARAAFVKLGARRYLVISILMAAAVVERDGQGRILRAAVAVGSASPVARRLRELEAELRGLAGRPSSVVAARHLAGLSPIDDVRATAGYRLEAALSAVGEALDRAAGVA